MKRLFIFGLVCLFSQGWSATVDNTAQICYLDAYSSQNTITSNYISVTIWERLLGRVWDLLTKDGIGTPTLKMAGKTKLGGIFGTYTLDPAYPSIHTLVVEKDGYFSGTRTIDLDKTQKQNIGLCPKARAISANTWKMWSPPSLPEDASRIDGANIIVGSDLGGLNRIGDLDIRCYRWDPSAPDDPLYSQYVRPSAIRTGESYWFKAYGDDVNLKVNGIANSSTQTINLSSGWNQIGNPFNFMVRKSDILIGTQSLTSDLWGWTDTEYLSSQAILPWKGYFLYAHEPCTITVPPVPLDDSDVSALSILNNNFLWSIQVSAQSGKYCDRENFIGVGKNGKADLRFEPPAPLEGIRLAVSGNLSRDIRSEMKDSQEWSISITSTTDEPITLSWSGVSAIPEEYGVWLIDGNKTIDMRKNSEFRIQNSELKIKIAKGGLINERLEITKVISYPNPSSGEVTFRSTLLTGGADLKVKIYNIVGQVVYETGLISKKDIDEKAQVCIYSSKFSCLNTSNQKLSNGLYFFQITASQNGKTTSKIGRMVISK